MHDLSVYWCDFDEDVLKKRVVSYLKKALFAISVFFAIGIGGGVGWVLRGNAMQAKQVGEVKKESTKERNLQVLGASEIDQGRIKVLSANQLFLRLMHTYSFSGTFVNISNHAVISPTTYIWLKDEQGRVIGLAVETLKAGEFLPKEELTADFSIQPLADDTVFVYRIKTFGEIQPQSDS